jgi:hypothetical protein
LSRIQELATAALERIAELWQVDKARVSWSTPSKGSLGGFDWWPGDYCVRVRADEAPKQQDILQARITVRTDFLKDIATGDEKFVRLAGLVSRQLTSTYAWVYAPPDLHAQSKTVGAPTMWFGSSAYISSDDIGWLPDFLAKAAVLQPINAQIQSRGMPELLGTGVPNMTRPDSLKDAGLDDILEVAAKIYVPLGQEPSRWSGSDEFEKFSEKWAKSDYCFGFGDPQGMSFETPFGTDTALVRLFATEKHPQLGNGLLATLQLPMVDDDLTMAKEAAELNFLEAVSWTNFPQLGCWHTNQNRGNQEGLAFSLFIPNALYMPGLASRTAAWFFQRARWVREQRFPAMMDLPMLEILNNRACV